jgi:hypothetical protein
MRYHVQGVSESVRFEILAGADRGGAEDRRRSSLCDERICEAAHAIEEAPWAWALGTSRQLRDDEAS